MNGGDEGRIWVTEGIGVVERKGRMVGS